MRKSRAALVAVIILAALATVAMVRQWPDGGAKTQAALHQILQEPAPPRTSAALWANAKRFYELRGGSLAWIDGRRWTSADQAVLTIRRAFEHGLDAANYGDPQIAAAIDQLKALPADSPDRDRRLAAADLSLTTALLSLGHDVSLGRSTPERLDPRWKARRGLVDLPATLNAAAGDRLRDWLNDIRPRHAEYASLQRALADLQAQQKAGTWSDPVPIGVRLQQVATNMERWRWMPDELGPNHVFVNIPSYSLAVRESGHEPLSMKVIVGQADDRHRTPIFSASMTTVVFSPYWNIPDTIADGEIGPAVAKDPGYLAKQNIDVLRVSRSGSSAIDPSSINWDDPEDMKQLAFRQRPGAANALGHVKFLLANPFNVYLHDTPADHLFAKPGRALSHGCVRLEQPEALAQYVLRDSPEWDEARIREAMHAGTERPVTLKQALPVHIGYFTAWVDDTGAVQFAKDVYRYDTLQARRH